MGAGLGAREQPRPVHRSVLSLEQGGQRLRDFDRFNAEAQQAFVEEIDSIAPQQDDSADRLPVEQQQASADARWQLERVVIEQLAPGAAELRGRSASCWSALPGE
jgi:hypothetical protein